MKEPTSKRMYVDNDRFLFLIKEYRKQPDGHRCIPEELGEIFKLLVDNLSFNRQFINYTDEWKNEMKSDALFNCCRYIGTFDPAKSSNPFAYFTMVIINAFKMRIKKEKFHLQKDGIIKKEIYQQFLDDFKLSEKKKRDGNEDDPEECLWNDEDMFTLFEEELNEMQQTIAIEAKPEDIPEMIAGVNVVEDDILSGLEPKDEEPTSLDE